MLVNERNSFPINKFVDLQYPVVAGISSLYVVLYISRLVERCHFFLIVLSFIGRNSLYIMALHIVGLFFCTFFIDHVFDCNNYEIGYNMYTYDLGNNIPLAVLYLSFGLVFPLASISIFRYLKMKIINICRSCG